MLIACHGCVHSPDPDIVHRDCGWCNRCGKPVQPERVQLHHLVFNRAAAMQDIHHFAARVHLAVLLVRVRVMVQHAIRTHLLRALLVVLQAPRRLVVDGAVLQRMRVRHACHVLKLADGDASKV